MKSTNFYILILLTLIVLASCQKDVNIKPDTSFTGQVFIESILYPGEIPKVYISKSLPFFNEKVSPQDLFARGAEVSITSQGVTDVLQADSTFDKFRCRWVPFYAGTAEAVFGGTYDLSVTYDGQTYTAQTTIKQSKVNLDDIEYIPEFYDIYGGHDGVILRFKDASGVGNFYRSQIDRFMDTSRHHAHILEVLKNTCTQGEKFWTRDLGRTIFSDEDIDGQRMELFIEVSFEYQAGDSAYIYLQSLDPKSAAFFQDMDLQLQSILNPFVEPVFLESVIEGTIGVFGSAVRSDPVLFIYPQDNP